MSHSSSHSFTPQTFTECRHLALDEEEDRAWHWAGPPWSPAVPLCACVLEAVTLTLLRQGLHTFPHIFLPTISKRWSLKKLLTKNVLYPSLYCTKVPYDSLLMHPSHSQRAMALYSKGWRQWWRTCCVLAWFTHFTNLISNPRPTLRNRHI